MTTLQTGTIEKPLDTPELARQALSALDRAWAMGLLPAGSRVDPVSLSSLQGAFAPVREAGIGQRFLAELSAPGRRTPASLLDALKGINRALEESPNPGSEWRRLDELLGTELLGGLVGASKVSVGRYASGRRPTPPEVAARLHYLAMLVADLVGSYNQFGIVGWFGRKRGQLEDRSPRQLLRGPWTPESEPARKVKALAEALSGSPAT